MGFFNKKKEEPKETKKEVLKKDLMKKSSDNVSRIILKVAKKREELYHLGKVPEDMNEEVDARFEKMVLYLQRVDWEEKIDKAMSNACLQDIDGAFQPDFVDPDTTKFLLNLTWQEIKEGMNSMINDLLLLIKEEKET